MKYLPFLIADQEPVYRRTVCRLSSLVLLLGLTACADMTGIRPHATLQDAASVGLPTSTQDTFAIEADWWKQFGDTQLNDLIAQALENSPGIKLAEARLARAQAQSAAAGATLGPKVNGQLDATRQRYTAEGMIPPPVAGSIQTTGTAQINGSWELDFFGRNRAAVEAAVGAERATAADTQAARILLSVTITRQYINLARLYGQLEVAERTLAQRQEMMTLVRDRVQAGLDTQLELRQSEGSLPQARQQIESVQEQIALSRHALAALVGKPQIAQQIAVPQLSALHAPDIPALLPADLLGRRADIVAARWRVEAASQDIRQAKAQFYPNINLTAFAGYSSIGLDHLFEGGSRQWGIGPAIRLPIFESGQLRANLRGKTADYDAAVASYNSTLIQAVHDVADQVASSASIAKQQQEQVLAYGAAENTYQIARDRYKAGLSNYLQVLSAETTLLAQRRQSVDLSARALESQVLLAHALGGGYVAEASQDNRQ